MGVRSFAYPAARSLTAPALFSNSATGRHGTVAHRKQLKGLQLAMYRETNTGSYVCVSFVFSTAEARESRSNATYLWQHDSMIAHDRVRPIKQKETNGGRIGALLALWCGFHNNTVWMQTRESCFLVEQVAELRSTIRCSFNLRFNSCLEPPNVAKVKCHLGEYRFKFTAVENEKGS